MAIAVGAAFPAYSELEQEHSVQYYKRDSRSIEAALRRAPNREFSEAIKYSELVYSCIHGGKKFTSLSSGKRPNQQ
jgi:zinc finger SWIM domain-containing protein 3